MKQSVIAYSFDTKKVRTIIDKNGMLWFAAIDICKILGIKNARREVVKLDEDEYLTYLVSTSGQGRSIYFVNEFGLYSLILRSRKPEAKQFKRWITHEVLPSIRKYGRYDGNTRKLLESEKLLNIGDNEVALVRFKKEANRFIKNEPMYQARKAVSKKLKDILLNRETGQLVFSFPNWEEH